jgi:hypothetical protein
MTILEKLAASQSDLLTGLLGTEVRSDASDERNKFNDFDNWNKWIPWWDKSDTDPVVPW